MDSTSGQPPTGLPVEETTALSPAEMVLLRADVQSCLRDARIREIRAQIKAGTFLTPQRKDGSVERLLKILG